MPEQQETPALRYCHVAYPSWRFAANGDTRLVNSPEDEPGEGWADSPSAFDVDKEAPDEVVKDKKTGKK